MKRYRYTTDKLNLLKRKEFNVWVNSRLDTAEGRIIEPKTGEQKILKLKNREKAEGQGKQ